MGQSKIEKRARVSEQVADSLQRMALGFLPDGHVVEKVFETIRRENAIEIEF